jgi:hypothetical protein
MKRYNCHNCFDRDKKQCFPEKRMECELRVPIGWQMVDDERKLAGFHTVMTAFNLQVETYPDGNFSIVQGRVR